MKKTNQLFFLIITLLSMVNNKAFAYNIAVKNDDGVNIFYNYINDGTELEVTYRTDDHNSYSGNVVIPEEVTYMTKTRKVTSIGECAFQECSSLTSVTIPNSVTSIKDAAFDRCGLTSVTIPHSVTSIGENAFSFCSNLTSIVVDRWNTIYDSRDNCNAIINTSTNELIAACNKTTIPNSVTSIGYGAFWSCSDLTTITIPNSVTNIEKEAFYNCSSLTFIVIESGNTVYDSRDNCNGIIETETNTLVLGCKNTTIPNSVTSIGDFAFYYCSSLTSVTIPNSVTSIGNGTFWGCI